ncbi:hypothetical protein [Microbulbifer sp. MCCC 1A16149]
MSRLLTAAGVVIENNTGTSKLDAQQLGDPQAARRGSRHYLYRAM